MDKVPTLILAWLPDGVLARLEADFPNCEFIDGRDAAVCDRHLRRVGITYGLPPVARLDEAAGLRWIQLISAGVPQDLCAKVLQRVADTPGSQLTVTNLAGLYGTTIAQHALALMLILTRNLHVVLRNQQAGRWDRDVAHTMSDLHGKTLAVVGLGNIGCGIARLARGFGMRIVGCRRTDKTAPFVDRQYPLAELHAMLAEGDYVAVAAPLTARTAGMLGPAEFAAMKPGAVYVNVSRGGVAQEQALLDSLRTGRLAGAGLDVYATEPLPPEHPFWSMPQVLVSPHYSGETVNNSDQPAARFARNLHAFLQGKPLEGIVDPDWGY
jgi:phosphoglycerate dehydrogenase-like enzyme